MVATGGLDGAGVARIDELAGVVFACQFCACPVVIFMVVEAIVAEEVDNIGLP